eukprot:1713-Eustigmatos_ZCMA.PRE.1
MLAQLSLETRSRPVSLICPMPRKQETLATVGAIEMLLGKLKTGDVDVLECATAAIANLVTCFEPNAIRIGKAGGVEILAGMGRKGG